jgi:translation initiation factor 2B subunit (eIF-2B alpha/beta/delta family)
VAPHTPAVAGAVRYLRSSVSRLPASLSLTEARAAVADAVEAYVAERVRAAAQVAAASLSLLPSPPPEPAARRRAAAVSSSPAAAAGGLTLWPGAVVMTFGRSAAVAAVLAAAHAQLVDAAEARTAPDAPAAAPSVHVVVVDARPDLRGQAAAAAYASAGMTVTYTQLASAPAALRSVDVLLLGAAAVLGDGAVLAAAGTAQLAAVAASAGVPVVVAAESFKLTDRVVTSSLAVNQAAPAGDVAHPQPHTPRKRTVPKALADALAAPVAAAGDAGAPAAATAPPQQPKGGKPGGKGAAAAAAAAPAVIPWVSTGVAGDAPVDAAGTLAGWRGVRGLKLAAVAYDVTPSGLVTRLLTEVGPLPPGGAGVAAVCRAFGRLEEAPQDDGDGDDNGEGSEREDEEGERDGGGEAGGSGGEDA